MANLTRRERPANGTRDGTAQGARDGRPRLAPGRDAAGDAALWIERLGRFGYAAKGVVYALVGVLALQAASGAGGATTGTRGALEQLLRAPLGQLILGAVAVGLVGYAVWRATQAVLDTEGQGDDAGGLAQRAAFAGTGVLYLALAAYAGRLLLHGGGGDESATEDWTARVLSWPFGPWLVGAAGLAVLGGGGFQLYRAYRATFRDKLRLHELTATQARWAVRLGRLGYAARGVAFGLIGAFLVLAAVQTRPEEARGLGGALATLAEQPFGPWLLGVVAAGLLAYGAFMLVQARYRKMVIR